MKGTVSERGQVTIPKRLRDELGIAAGQVLDFQVEQGRLAATKTTQRDPVDFVRSSFADLVVVDPSTT